MEAIDKEKVIKGLEHCRQYGSLGGLDCTGLYAYMDESGKILKVHEHRCNCPYRHCETGCVVTLIDDAVALLKEQEQPKSVKEPRWTDNNVRKIVRGICPWCNCVITHMNGSFCDKCGKAVKWE